MSAHAGKEDVNTIDFCCMPRFFSIAVYSVLLFLVEITVRSFIAHHIRSTSLQYQNISSNIDLSVGAVRMRSVVGWADWPIVTRTLVIVE